MTRGRASVNESGRWMLNFDIMYANPGDDVLDINVLGVQFTVNVMSHQYRRPPVSLFRAIDHVERLMHWPAQQNRAC